jgi:hypothetical protein
MIYAPATNAKPFKIYDEKGSYIIFLSKHVDLQL